MPVSEGPASPAATPRSPQSKAPQWAAPPKPQSDGTVARQSEPPRESRPADYRAPRIRSPRGSRRVRVSRRGSRRSRSRRRYTASAPADAPRSEVREDRLSAWAVGRDSKGSRRVECNVCASASARTPPGIRDVPAKSWETSAAIPAGLRNAMAPVRAIGPATDPRAVRSKLGKPHTRPSTKIEGPFALMPSGLRFYNPWCAQRVDDKSP